MINNNKPQAEITQDKLTHFLVLHFLVFLHSPADKMWDTCIFYLAVIVLSETVGCFVGATLYSY